MMYLLIQLSNEIDAPKPHPNSEMKRKPFGSIFSFIFLQTNKQLFF